MSSEKKSITTKELAKLAGVNQSTVSRALNNHSRIPKDTRDKILKLADEHGYKKNPVVSKLMHELRKSRHISYKSNLAIFISESKSEYLQQPLPSLFYEGIQQQAAKLGYKIDLISLRDDLKKKSQSLSRILRSRNIQGIILTSIPGQIRRLNLNWDQFAVLIQGYGILRPNFDRITAHHYQNMYTTLRLLQKRRYRRIGFFWDPYIEQRVNNGFINAMRDYQFHLPDQNIISLKNSKIFDPPPPDPLLTCDRFDEWYQKNKPDMVITPAYHAGLIYQWKKNEIPKKFGLVSLPWDPSGQVASSDISGVNENFSYVGTIAANLLISKVETSQFGIPQSPTTHLIEGFWVEGKTTRK